jgi:hypothetical protein
MCNKLCNCLFSELLAKRPDTGRLTCSGRVGGAQILDALAGDESTWYGWDELAQEHNK